jgi:hypothetical protein
VTPPVRPEPQDDLDKIIAARRAALQTPAPDPVDALIAERRAALGGTAHGATASFTDEAPESGFTETMLAGFPFGTKVKAGVDAATGPLSYDQELLNRRAALEKYRSDNPWKARGASVLGGAAPFVATFGGSGAATGAAEAPTLLARLASASKVGAASGALQGASEAHGSVKDYRDKMLTDAGIGAVVGPAMVPLASAAGYVAKKAGLPELIGKGAESLGLSRLGQMVGAKGQAADVVGSRLEQDLAAGHTPQPLPGVPSLPLDQGGTNVHKLAEGIAHRPGEGATQIAQTLTARLKQMRPSIREGLEEGTGLSAKDAKNLKPSRELVASFDQKAREFYDAARKETEGQPVASVTLDAIRKTPAGKAAETWALVQKANRQSALPMKDIPAGPAPGFSQQQWDGFLSKLREQGQEIPSAGSEPLPDPETVHFMKQYLAKLARLGVHDGHGGTLATQAEGIVGLWGQVRNELPEAWRTADDFYAKGKAVEQLMNEGRNIFRTQTNPPGNLRAALNKSLSGHDKRLAKASPEGREAAQKGSAMAAHTLLDRMSNSTKSPGRVFAQSEERVSQLAHAFPDPKKAQAFQERVKAWDTVQERTNDILGNSRTSGRDAEAAARSTVKPSALRQLLSGHPRQALDATLNAHSTLAQRLERERVDAIVAKMLTDPKSKPLTDALTTKQLRQLVQEQTRKRLPAILAGGVTANEQ